MDIQAEKIELVKLLLNTSNPSVIQSIKDIFSKSKPEDFWNELTTEQQYEIDKATQQILNEDSTDYKSFMDKHR